MQRVFSASILATCLLAAATAVRAQDCSNLSNWDLRGTYSMSGQGWMDLSKLIPGAPSGTVPFAWVGSHVWDGAGGGSGWVSVNAGGLQLTVQFVGLTYAVKADCSLIVSFAMTAKEMPGLKIGPVTRVLVIAGKSEPLELFMTFLGGGPGMPVDVGVSRRISMQY